MSKSIRRTETYQGLRFDQIITLSEWTASTKGQHQCMTVENWDKLIATGHELTVSKKNLSVGRDKHARREKTWSKLAVLRERRTVL